MGIDAPNRTRPPGHRSLRRTLTALISLTLAFTTVQTVLLAVGPPMPSGRVRT